jgi:catechol 2,3-dioxygenase-like lactoylglutathione lyase family enzyme
MIDHMALKVSDVARAKAFYGAALAPLGYEILMEFQGEFGLGVNKKPDFWLVQDPANVRPLHLAFRADSREVVDRFHAAALAAGGKDNGGPGVRAHYHPTYYGAFVLDPDGHNVEAVCHRKP